MDAKETVTAYLNAFNRGDWSAMLDLLDDGIEHHVNEGGIRKGKARFGEFLAHMDRCYAEELTDIVVFGEGDRAAAEFVVNGTYKATDEGLPEATGQTYKLPAGSFFALEGGKITRVTTYYNLADWTRQVVG